MLRLMSSSITGQYDYMKRLIVNSGVISFAKLYFSKDGVEGTADDIPMSTDDQHKTSAPTVTQCKARSRHLTIISS